jgi:hypothetical protein
MDGPLMGEFQLVRHRGDDFCYSEGSMASGGELYCSVWQGQVLGFEPDQLALFVVHFGRGFVVRECVEGAGGEDPMLS